MDTMNPGMLYKRQAAGFPVAAQEEGLAEQASFAAPTNTFRGRHRTSAATLFLMLQIASSEEFLQRFGLRLAQLIAPATPVQAVQQAIRQILCEAAGLSSATAAPQPPLRKEQRQLELVFVHDCRYE